MVKTKKDYEDLLSSLSELMTNEKDSKKKDELIKRYDDLVDEYLAFVGADEE